MIEKSQYSIACKEVLEILKYIKTEEINKIPTKEIEVLKKNANWDYEFKYNPKISIKEQKVSRLAKAIIANYFIEYIANDEQKQVILEKQSYDMKMIEENLKIDTDINQIFCKRINEDYEVSNNKLLVIKKESFFKRIYEFFKKIFRIN